TSTTCASRTRSTTSSPRASRRSTPTKRPTVTDEPTRRPPGPAGRGISVAADAERGLRGAGAGLGLRAAGDRAGGARARRRGACLARLRGGERDDPAQASSGLVLLRG